MNLQEFLPAATVMVVSVTASTTQGSPISQEDLDLLLEGCRMVDQLNDMKINILDYVESRMSLVAPNLSVILGSSIAAKMMGVAGGLTSLSKMPACNILVLGSQRKTLTGFSTTTSLPHTGFIFYSDLVQSCNEDIRKKVARLVACKCTLAARVDSFHEPVNSSVGQNLRDEIQQKTDKWQEPPPVKLAKPLPRPDDTIKKRRGGKRVRKQKER